MRDLDVTISLAYCKLFTACMIKWRTRLINTCTLPHPLPQPPLPSPWTCMRNVSSQLQHRHGPAVCCERTAQQSILNGQSCFCFKFYVDWTLDRLKNIRQGTLLKTLKHHVKTNKQTSKKTKQAKRPHTKIRNLWKKQRLKLLHKHF